MAVVGRKRLREKAKSRRSAGSGGSRAANRRNRGDEIPELEHGALPSRRSRGGKEPRRMNASGAACSRHLPLWGRSSSRSDGGRGVLAFHNQPPPSPSLPHKGREQFAAGSYLHKRPERRKACRGARE